MPIGERSLVTGLVALGSAAGGLIVGLALGAGGGAPDEAALDAATRLESRVAEREEALGVARRELDELRTRLDRAEKSAALETGSAAEEPPSEGEFAAGDEMGEADSDVPPTLESILADLRGRDPRARFRALRDLDLLSPEDRAKAVEAVKEMLGEENPGLRFAALEALVKLSPDEAAPLLAQFATDPAESEFIRSRALDALAARNDSAAAAAIQKAYESGMKGPAARALQKMGDNSLAEAYYDELARDLSNPDSALRARAISSMGSLKLPSSLARISESADDANSNVRQSVATALGSLGDAAALPALRKLADDPVESVKRSAKFAIRRIENPGEEGDRFRGGDFLGWSGDGGRGGSSGRRR